MGSETVITILDDNLIKSLKNDHLFNLVILRIYSVNIKEMCIFKYVHYNIIYSEL